MEYTTELCVFFFSLFSLCILCLSLSLLRQCLHVFNKCHNHKQHSCHIFALFLFLLSCAPIYLVLYQYFCYFSFFLVLIIMVGHESMVSHDVHAGSKFSFHLTWWRTIIRMELPSLYVILLNRFDTLFSICS